MSELKRKAAKGFVWDLLGVFSQNGISFFISIFLARLLSPAEFGLVGMAMVFISLAQVFMDMGFASALIQKKEENERIYSSVFFLNIFVGLLLSVAVFFSAGLIAAFYKEPQLSGVVRWLSPLFIVSAFSIVQRTVLTRNIDFKKLTIRNIVSQIIGGVVGVAMAFRGYGVYALIVQQLLAAVINSVMLWYLSKWRPVLIFSWQDIKSLTGFSFYVFMSQVANRMVTKLDVLIVGKMFSATNLGFYTRAHSLNTLVSNYSSTSIMRVFFPVLSKLQDDDEQYRKVYLQLSTIVAFVSFALTGFLIFAAKDIVVLLFGEKWMPSVFIFQVLCLKAFTYPSNSITVNAILSKGFSKENFWIGNIRRTITAGALILSSFFGLEALLWAVVLSSYINTIINFYFMSVKTNITLKVQLLTFLPYALIFGVAFFSVHLVIPSNIVFAGFAKAITFIVLYLLINTFFKTGGWKVSGSQSALIWKKLKGKYSTK